MKRELHEISKPEYYNKLFSTRCIVSGKGTQPYYVPFQIEIQCASTKCEGKCGYGEAKIIELKAEDEAILMFIDIPSFRISRVLANVFKISCPLFTHKLVQMQVIERIFISQLIGKDKNKWGFSRVAYYIGHDIETNTTYEINGYTTVDPSSQMVTYVITSLRKLQSDIDIFSLSSAIVKRLKKFQTKSTDETKMFAELRSLYTSYAHNVTKIYGDNRFLLHLSVDLAFHSVLSFDFSNERVYKGWVDAMIIGDPRCGKGYVAERLSQYYGVGEVIGADNASYAGLVGGLQQIQKHWIISWGKIPINDKGLLIIDEASEIRHEDWSKLSRVRSEGIAEVTKIQAQMTNARTRLLFIANPPYRTVSNYSYGIQALSDIVKTPEDIARFDYVCVVAHDEVPIKTINEAKSLLPSIYVRQAEKDLITWTWSRRSDQIKFTKEAVNEIYKQSIHLAEVFDYSIPLIQGENVRIKLSKLAICFASRFFSSCDNYEKILVKEEHVRCATLFFMLLYKSESNGYFIYSQLFRSSSGEVATKSLHAIEIYFRTYNNRHEIYTFLMMTNTITVNDMAEFLGKSKDLAIEIISRLLRNGCIMKKRSGYVKVPFFTTWLKHKIQERMKQL